MENVNNPDNSDNKVREYLNSFSGSTYLAELDVQLEKLEAIVEPGERLFYFNSVIKQLITSAMFEYEHCKAELDELYWRYTFSCHPGEEIVIKKEMEMVRENLKDLEKVFVKARKSQPQI